MLRRFAILTVFCFSVSLTAFAQSAIHDIVPIASDPSGACTGGTQLFSTPTGHLWQCVSSAWTQVNGGGGSYTLPPATTSTLGGVKCDGTTTSCSSGIISSLASGATQVSQLKDFALSIASNTATFGANCSSGAPCNVQNQDVVTSFTNSFTFAPSGSDSGSWVAYIDYAGVAHFDSQTAAGTCTRCTFSTVASPVFPSNSKPLASGTITSGTISGTFSDKRAAFSTGNKIAVSSGATVAQSAGTTTLGVDTTVVQAISNNPVVQSSYLGIKCDGSTDDSSAIRTAFAGGYSIVFPDAKTCIYNNTSYPSAALSNQKIYSAGRTTILFTNNANPGFVVSSMTKSTLDGFIFDYQTRATSRTSCPVPLWIQGGSNDILTNITILSSGCSATLFQNISNFIVSNIIIPQGGVYADGLHFEHCHNVTLSGAVVDTSVTGDDALAMHDFNATAQTTFGTVSNVVLNAGAKCFSIDGGYGIVVSNSQCNGSSADGVQIYADSFATFTPDKIKFSNVYFGNTSNGTGLGGGNGAIEVNNVGGVVGGIEISDITVDGTTGTCVFVNDSATTKTLRAIIRNLDCRNPTVQGVWGNAGLSWECDHCNVYGSGNQGFSSGLPTTICNDCTVTDSNKTGGNGRAFDFEGSSIAVWANNILVFDDQATATITAALFEAGVGSGRINGFDGASAHGSITYASGGSGGSKKLNWGKGVTQPSCSANVDLLKWDLPGGGTSGADTQQICVTNGTTYGWAKVF